MSDLIIKEEDKWEIASAVNDLIRASIKVGILDKEGVSRMLDYVKEKGAG